MTDNITLPRAVVEQIRDALEAMQSYAAAERKGLRICDEAVITITAALAEPEQGNCADGSCGCCWTDKPDAKPEPVAFAKNGNLFWCGDASQMRGVDIDLYPAPPQPDAKPEPVHPGYIIGSHWLETAYSRIAAGEAEADVLTEVLGARGWAKPKPYPVAWMESPHGAIRANPLYRITAPQSLAWSIPLYAAPPAATREPATREQVYEAFDRSDAVGFWNYCYIWREAERFHGITKEDKT
jgi:hypothetical protein